MLKSIDIIKEQIKAIHKDEKDLEIKELRDLIEFINYDREILLAENQRLTKLINESTWKSRFFEAKEELLSEKARNQELAKRVEELEDIINSSLTDRSAMETGSLTDRTSDFYAVGRRSEEPLNSSSKYFNGKIKHSNTFEGRSPQKPPRGEQALGQKSPTKASVQIKTSLAKAIAEAHKTLFITVQHKKPKSPCLSAGSSRYSTPPKNLPSLNANSNN